VELFTEDGTYAIPPLGYPDANPKNDLFIVSDDHSRLVARAERLLKREAHVEYPHSTTRHMVNNVRIEKEEDGVIYVNSSFIAYRTKREIIDAFVGQNKYKLVKKDGKLKISDKRVILDLDTLRPHGKVSIIL
jgi:p-cumate 2,3-dioxygenase subunit beta